MSELTLSSPVDILLPNYKEKMEIECPNCNSVNHDDSKFCKECVPAAQGIERWIPDPMSWILLTSCSAYLGKSDFDYET